MGLRPLDPDRLRRRCDVASLPFETTAEVEPTEGTIGQPRALAAISFGLDMETPGYNVFATGPTGTGKRTMIEAHLREHAERSPTPEDWLYLHNFVDVDQPIALSLPAGAGRELAARMRRFVEEARHRVPAAFESESYEEKRRALAEEIQQRREEALGEIREFARERDLALDLTPGGLITVPTIEGRPIPPAEFQRLSEGLREQVRKRIAEVEERVPAVLRRLRRIERDGGEQLEKLDREVALFAIGHLVDELKEEHGGVAKLDRWFEQVREDVIERLRHFREQTPESEGLPEPIAAGMRRVREGLFARYEPNVFISHAEDEGAPVVFESNPTFYNLFGRVEYEATFGALSTDHRHIKAGALHRANGGYLVLDAVNVLTQPFVWVKLKESLRSRRVEIETVASQFASFPAATLEPESIELDLKVVLVGPPRLHALLCRVDEDIRKLFKVRADFAIDMPWEEAAGPYPGFIAA